LGAKTECIIDSGCDVKGVVISYDTVKDHGFPTEPCDPFSVQVANGHSVKCDRVIRNAPIKLGKFKDKCDLYVLPIKGLQVVFGSQWLVRRNPVIDWSSGTMTIKRGTIKGTLNKDGTPKPFFATTIFPKKNHSSLSRLTSPLPSQTTECIEEDAQTFKKTLKGSANAFKSRYNKDRLSKDHFRRLNSMQAMYDSCCVAVIRPLKDADQSINIVLPPVSPGEVDRADGQFDRADSFTGADSALRDSLGVQSPPTRRASGNEFEAEILSKFGSPDKDVFPVTLKKGLPVDRPNQQQHFIPLIEGAKPYSRSPFKCSQAELEELKKQLEYYLDQGWIRPSHSPWGAPVLFVPKKNGKIRFCVDYRQLNDRTIKSTYPLPNIENIMENLQGMKYFSKIDLSQGYHQVKVHTDDIYKTAMNTRYGQYEWLVMNFGLTNAPATFMQLLHSIFHDLLDVSMIVFIDDILIFSKTLEEHRKHVDQVLERLWQNQLFANWEKCAFNTDKVDYCGVNVSAKGISVHQDKVQAVSEWPIPKSVRDIRSFLGLAGYYRRFIPNYAAIARPMTALTKKDVTFDFNEDCVKSFETLKERLRNAPVLILPDQTKPYTIVPDSSGYAVGGIIMQEASDGSGLHPIAYVSRQMINAELRYPVNQQELLSIFYICKQFRHLLMNHHVTAHTDHKPLKHLHSQPYVAPRIARWLDFLADFDLLFVPIKGSTNPADHISRRPDYQQNFEKRQAELKALPPPNVSDDDDETVPTISTFSPYQCSSMFSETSNSYCLYSSLFSDAPDYTMASDIMHAEESSYPPWCEPAIVEVNDPLWGDDPTEFCKLCNLEENFESENDLPYNTHEILPDPDFVASIRKGYETDSVATVLFDPTAYKNTMMKANYVVVDSLIYRKVEDHLILYIPHDSTIHKDEVTEYTLREELIRQCHDVPTYGHQGRDRTYELCSRNFYWPGMRRDVAEYVSTCRSCQRAKPRRHKPYGQTRNLETPVDNWQDIAMDFIMDVAKSKSGHNAILVVMDLLSKRAHFLACKIDITAVQTATLFMREIYRHHGLPLKIVTDRDSRFTSKFWVSLFQLLDTRLAMSTPFHPNTDPAERVNQSLEIMLRMYTNDNSTDWDDYLPAVEFAHNNALVSSTGFTPFQLDTGRHPITPASLLTSARARQGRIKSTNQFIAAWRKHIDQARANIDAQKAISKSYRDKGMLPKEFAVGEMVWLSSKHVNYPGKLKKPKFSDLYLGPCEVISVLPNKMAYKLKLPAHIKCHDVQPISRLEPFNISERFEHPERPPDTSTVYSDGSKEYTVEAVVDKRFVKYGRGGRTEYLIKYQGAPAFENEWKKASELKHCKRLVQEYEEAHRV
jgi:hypothetical protein